MATIDSRRIVLTDRDPLDGLRGVPPLIRTARERFHDCAEAEKEQRESSLLAKRFLALDQWDQAIKTQREGGIAIQGQPAQPPRPCLTLDCVSEPHQAVINAILEADFAVKVAPIGDATDDTATVIQGIIRQIQVNSRDDAGMEWAADNAAGCGLGWAGVKSQYCREPNLDESPSIEDFDQDLVVYRIPNCLSVYVDTAACSPTRRDMRYAFVTEDVPRDEFQRRYPKADLKGLEDFRASGDDKDRWVTVDTVRIATYYHIETDPDELCLMEDGSVAWKSDKPKGTIERSRQMDRPTVECDTISACEILESYTWGGTTIPLVPIFGQEMNVDGKTIFFGVTQRAIGPQQMVNFTFSGAAETLALAPKSPFIIAEGQLEGYEQIWAQANRANYSYLPYKPTTLTGQLVGPPQRNQAEPPIQAMATVMQMSLDAVRRTTSFDPSLGQMPGRQMAADAIEALQQQGQLARSNYLNAVRRAYLRLGEILVEAIPVYYEREGRIVQILGLEDQPSTAMVNAPHTVGPNGPVPVTASTGGTSPTGASSLPPPPSGGPGAPPQVLHYDLKKGRYSVTVEVGKSFTTRREEGVAALAEFAKTVPELVPKYADLWVKEMDFPGSEAVAERIAPPPPPAGMPPQMAQAMQALQAENTQLKQAIATKMPQLESQQKIAAAQNATQIMKQRIATSGQMVVGLAKVDAENQRSFADAFEARLAHDEGFRMHIAETLASAATQGREHAADAIATAAGHEHERAMLEAEQAHEANMARMTHEHAIQQAQTQAALNPPETPAPSPDLTGSTPGPQNGALAPSGD